METFFKNANNIFCEQNTVIQYPKDCTEKKAVVGELDFIIESEGIKAKLRTVAYSQDQDLTFTWLNGQV